MPYKTLSAKQAYRKQYYKDHKDKENLAHQKWIDSNPGKLKILVTSRRKQTKELVISHYGNRCACPKCPEPNSAFLTVDHINNDGNTHLIYNKRAGGHNLYLWLIKNNFPPGFQTLCWNCNCGRNYNGGICPHEDTRNLRGEH